MAVGKRGVLVALLGRYPVPGPGRASAGAVALRDGFPSPGWPGAQTGDGTPPLGMLPGWPAASLARRLAARLPDSLTQEPPQAGLARRRGFRGTGAAAARVVNPFTMWFAPIGKPRQGALLRATR